jgi:hypothetical protein
MLRIAGSTLHRVRDTKTDTLLMTIVMTYARP